MGGSATNSGIDFQSRVGALAMVAMLAETYELASLGLADTPVVDEVHFETSEAVDDLMLSAQGTRVYIQAKRTASVSIAIESEFSSVVRQFVGQHLRDPHAVAFVLATTSKASSRVTRVLRKLTDAARLNSGHATNPSTLTENRVRDITYAHIDHHFRALTKRPITDAERTQIVGKIHVLVLDLEAGESLERAVLSILESKGLPSARAVWTQLITLAMILAKDRQSIDRSGLLARLGNVIDLDGAHTATIGMRSSPPVIDAVDEDVASLERSFVEERDRLMSRFDPGNWCCPPVAERPELVLRMLFATPEPVQLGPLAGRTRVTLLHGEDREDLIETALESAAVTSHLRALRPIWHWVRETGWHTYGSGSPEVTTTELQLEWTAYRSRNPIGVYCSVLTGMTIRDEPGLVIAIDVAFNLLELNEHRQPAEIAHHTLAPPAPAALSLTELADLIVALLAVPDVGLKLTKPLIGSVSQTGYVGMWLSLNGPGLERVVNLTSIKQLPGRALVSRFETQSPFPLSEHADSGLAAYRFATEFLSSVLETAGHRRFREALAAAVRGPSQS